MFFKMYAMQMACFTDCKAISSEYRIKLTFPLLALDTGQCLF